MVERKKKGLPETQSGTKKKKKGGRRMGVRPTYWKRKRRMESLPQFCRGEERKKTIPLT